MLWDSGEGAVATLGAPVGRNAEKCFIRFAVGPVHIDWANAADYSRGEVLLDALAEVLRDWALNC